jgi:hypothetical protein
MIISPAVRLLFRLTRIRTSPSRPEPKWLKSRPATGNDAPGRKPIQGVARFYGRRFRRRSLWRHGTHHDSRPLQRSRGFAGPSRSKTTDEEELFVLKMEEENPGSARRSCSPIDPNSPRSNRQNQTNFRSVTAPATDENRDFPENAAAPRNTLRW